MTHRGITLLVGGTLLWSACHLVNGLDDYTFDGAPGVGGAGGAGGGTSVSFSVSVQVSGLVTSLTAQLGDEALSFDADGTLVFAEELAEGTTYDVTFDPPDGEQCVSENATGELSEDVEVLITCTPLVRPQYPSAPNWLDYLTADGTAPCDATSVARYTDCIHGGERMTVFVPGATDCAGVAGRDTQDAFNWKCNDGGEHVVLESRGLNPEIGLTDLIDFSAQAFMEMTVDITSPAGTVTTPPAVWWGNSFATAGPATTHDQAGTIYLVLEDPMQGLSADGDQVAIVVDPAVTFTSGTDQALSTTGVNFVWFEGAVDRDVVLGGTKMAVVRKLTMAGRLNLQSNVALRAHGLNITDGTPCLQADGNTGLAVEYATLTHCVRAADFDLGIGGYMREVRAVDSLNSLRIRNADGFAVDRMLLSNFQSAPALNIQSSMSVHVTRLISASSNADGVRFECTNCSLRGATATSSVTNGFLVIDSVGSWVENLLAVNNGLTGINISNTTVAGRNWVAVSQRSSGTSVNLNVVGSTITLGGILRLGSADVACTVDSSTGILADGSCLSAGASTFSLSGGNANSMFVAKVTMDDQSNASDTAGEAPYDPGLDWAQYDRETRAWGGDGLVFPNVSNQGACSPTNTNCRIWDWALIAGNTFAADQNADPIGSATAMVGGQTFLINAFEVLGDGVGDDDTLCESGERCGTMPNVGGYQGHGQPVPLAFEDGTITGVELFEFSDNGG